MTDKENHTGDDRGQKEQREGNEDSRANSSQKRAVNRRSPEKDRSEKLQKVREIGNVDNVDNVDNIDIANVGDNIINSTRIHVRINDFDIYSDEFFRRFRLEKTSFGIIRKTKEYRLEYFHSRRINIFEKNVNKAAPKMILREWAPLSDLFNKLPAKAQSGIFTYDIKLTCVDVLPEFIALGTNFGLVYWYNRKTKDLQKLRCESTNVPITTVKIISTVDYMVACGNSEGNISIFQVPKSHHELLPKNLRPKNKQVERYTVSDLHVAPITALQWAKNGMKLFSGDTSGHIVLTEIDFYMHLCKSVEILNESYEVVQLSYQQQCLLVSTTYRSIICKKESKWKVSQIGKKDRKVLGSFGGIFYQSGLRSNDVVLYCTRPGLRIWVSDMEGTVQQTLLFKDILNQRTSEAQVINPVSKNIRKLLPQKEASFGILLPFSDELLITYSNDVVYIVNPKQLTVNSMVSNLRGVLGVAACKDEIFILEGERSLIRLSEQPEPNYDLTPPIPTASNFLPITTTLKDLTHKLQSGSLSSVIPPLIGDFNIHTDITSVINAEEAFESPRRMKPNEAHKKLQIYDQISNQNFDDDILYKPFRRQKKYNMAASISSCSSNSSEERENNVIRPTLLNVSTFGMLPDLRSPESIKNDIENKEKILADVLCFDKVKIPPEPHAALSKDNVIPIIESSLNNSNSSVSSNKDVEVVELFKSCSSTSSGKKMENESSVDNNSVMESHKNYESISSSAKMINESLEYGPPSGSSNCNSLIGTDVPVCMNIPNDWQLQKVHTKNNRKATDSSISDSEWEIV
ncbi:hypothetical protein FQA39_LY12682 [Lamprigera yunnana]|nr:hypothetical protein FQA39_LY12682 [Lamprigera yunnana]